MEKIAKIWFRDQRIYMKTHSGKEYSRPLEAFPLLLEASRKQREDFKISMHADAVRWESIDEDIHINSFFKEEEPEWDNPVARIFSGFPELNVSQVANSIGINKALLSQYIYGMKKPSEKRLKEIEDHLHLLGDKLKNVSLTA